MGTVSQSVNPSDGWLVSQSVGNHLSFATFHFTNSGVRFATARFTAVRLEMKNFHHNRTPVERHYCSPTLASGRVSTGHLASVKYTLKPPRLHSCSYLSKHFQAVCTNFFGSWSLLAADINLHSVKSSTSFNFLEGRCNIFTHGAASASIHVIHQCIDLIDIHGMSPIFHKFHISFHKCCCDWAFRFNP